MESEGFVAEICVSSPSNCIHETFESLMCCACHLFSFVTLFFRKLGLLIEIRFLDLHVIDMSLCYTKVGSWSLSFLPGREEGVIPS